MTFPGYQVWTQNTSPEWLAKSCGIGDMLLATGLSEPQANSLAERYGVARKA
ncbi:hypothetical protein ABT282_07240 [Streptomyces sp. NPDC000927]|uniref:hypothetical protein n=1 Tax=Streptomyces sp. NPDC000927 TaxID=3154371 RepID=UPI003330CE22